MPRRPAILLIAALIAALTAFAALPAGAADIAWDKVIGAPIDRMNADQRGRAEALLNRLRNTRGCKGTLAECLAQGDQTARRHAGYVVRMVRKEKTDSFIENGIKDRATSAFPSEILKPDIATHPRRGPADAPVQLVEYACFQCPFCAHLAEMLEARLRREFGQKVAHVYKFFPVRSHSRGVQSALAGVAAHRQGLFWKFYDLAYANRTKLEDADLRAYAGKAGLDLGKYDEAIKDAAVMKLIEKDKLEGMRYGVEGTPTFLVNGKLYLGQNDVDEIIDRLGEELDIIEGRIK
jgi:protein-disulfide isomerase